MKIIIIIIGILFSVTFLFSETLAFQPNFPHTSGITVYPNQGWYSAKDLENNPLINSNIPESVIQTVLDKGGDIYIAGGIYSLSKDFTGFNLKANTHLILAQDAKIIVPSGYTGYVFRFHSDTTNCVMEGGSINEDTPVKRKWIGILMQGDNVVFNYVKNMIITNPYIAIDFDTKTRQYVNANTFLNINVNNFVRGIEFDFTGSHTPGRDGFDGNTFTDLQFQSGPMTEYGIKDIKHNRNTFYNVQIWDLPLDAISASIDQSADNTMIIGGLLTNYGNFVNKGHNTVVLDPWHKNFSSNYTFSPDVIKGETPSELNKTILSDQTSNGTITNQTNPNMVETPISANATSFTSLKIAANLWSKDQLSDIDFGENIKSLIRKGIIENPSQMVYQSMKIPTWFKSTARWWADGQISDSDFISGIQFLLANNIMQIVP